MQTRSEPLPPMQRVELDAWLDAGARALGLAMDPEHRTSVLDALRDAGAMAAQLGAHSLRPEDETAPVFVPLGPGAAPVPAPRRR